MKKFLLTALFAGMITLSLSGAESAQVRSDSFMDRLPDKLLFYIPNRLLDALDAFTVNLGVGPVVQARLIGTRLCDVGAGYGMSAKLYKAHNRQYGVGVEEMWYWSLISIGQEKFSIIKNSDWVDNYTEIRTGMPDPTVRTYDYFTGPRDYWAIGGALGCLVDGEVYLHPVEWLDFALGFFLIDIRNDDLNLDSFER